MGKIIPKVGSKIKFNVWYDPELLGVTYTEIGNGKDRPSSLDEWVGKVVEITEPIKYGNGKNKRIGAKNTYWVIRDFDGEKQPLTTDNIMGYA